MVEEVAKQNNPDVPEPRAIDFTPERAPTRTETPMWPTSRQEEDSRRDLLSKYPSQDTASGYLPQFRGSFAANDARFENLSRGSRLFTAESIGVATADGGGDRGGARGLRRNESSAADLRGLFSDVTSRHLVDSAGDRHTIYGGSARGGRLRSEVDSNGDRHVIYGDAAPNRQDIYGGAGPNRTEVDSAGEQHKIYGRSGPNSSEIDIFAQLNDKNVKKVEAKSDGKSDGKEVKDDADDETPANLPRDVKVDYPDGKGGLEAKRDKDGNLSEFTLKDKNGEVNFHKDEAGRWIKTDRFGVESIVNGQFELSKNNELAYKKPNGEVHIHKTDGTISKGRVLPDGSTVTLDDTGKKATVLDRKDGSKVEAEYDKNELSKVVETDKSGKNRTTWTKDENGVWHSKGETKGEDGQWKDDGKPSAERRNLDLNVNGRYSYEDKLAFKHVLNGDGTERIEPKITANKDGTKTVEIQYPDGKGFRTITLDKDNKVTKFSEQDEDGKRTYFRDKDGEWHLKAGLKNVKVGGDFKLEKNGDFVSIDKDRYDIQKLDGSIIHEKVNANGTRLRLNDDNTVSKLTRKDGSVVEIGYENGEKKQIVDTNKNETQRTVWTKNDKGVWVSESQSKDKDGKWAADGKPSEQRKEIEVNSQGLTIATDVRGFKHVIGADGSKLNEGPGGSKFTFDQQGRIESITYGPGANRQFKFQYDDKDNLTKVEVRDGKGNLQQTRTKTGEGEWRVTKADGSDGGSWKGNMKLSAEGNFLQQDSKDIAAGQWQVITPGYDKYNEKVSSDGRNITRIYPDKSEVQSQRNDKGEELVTKITRGKESREFRYDSNGKLSEVVDTTDKGTRSWKPEGDKVKIYPNGDVAYEKGDGSAVIKKGNFSTVELDKDGDITRVTTKDGKTRSFSYEDVKGKKELTSITDVRPTKDGEKTETWSRKRNSDGSVCDQFVSPGAGGKEKVRAGIEVLQDGDYKYKGNDGKDRIAKVGKSDDQGGFSENTEEARERLMEAMDGHLDEARRARFQQMVARFEQRSKERVEAQTAGGMSAEQAQQEWDQKVAKTFDHLTNMLKSDAPNATYDLATRSKLVENMVYAMAWPVKANDQGNWGCCWMISGVYLGMIQHPDKMSKMLSELSTSGTFTDTNGKTWTPDKRLLSFTDQGGNWTIGNCGNGRRSPVSEILTSVAANLSQDGRRMDRGASGGTMEGCMHAMKLITGDTWRGTNQQQMTSAQYKQDLLLKGGVILFSPGHMYLGTMEKNNGQWQITSSLQHGDQGRHVNGVLTDLKAWNVTGGGRRQYTPDVPNFPGVTDKPVGPNGPNPGPNRPRNRNSFRDDPDPGSPGDVGSAVSSNQTNWMPNRWQTRRFRYR